MFYVKEAIACLSTMIFFKNVADIDNRAGVYFLWQGNRCLYIGQSNNVHKRLNSSTHQYLKYAKAHDYLTDISVLWTPEHRKLEYMCIKLLHPEWNGGRTMSAVPLSEIHQKIASHSSDMFCQTKFCFKTELQECEFWRESAQNQPSVTARILQDGDLLDKAFSCELTLDFNDEAMKRGASAAISSLSFV